jgi:histone-lysine N-methyltransferase SETD8
MLTAFVAGYGVFAEKDFKKGDYLMEYKGDLIEEKDAAMREECYATQNLGCYLLFFKNSEKTMW